MAEVAGPDSFKLFQSEMPIFVHLLQVKRDKFVSHYEMQ